MSSGTLAGFPVVDVTATLYDGSFHDVDSSVLAFQIAARAAFREGMRKGAVRLLEPIMKVGVCSGPVTLLIWSPSLLVAAAAEQHHKCEVTTLISDSNSNGDMLVFTLQALSFSW